jgi:uncharacterized repeat protein (TIGR03803 family)
VLLPGLLATRSAQAQTLSVLHSFTCGADGQYPSSGVIRDSSGNLYGTTWYGGTYTWGTVFKLPKNGQEKVLHSFTGKADGAVPSWGVMQDSRGNLYGTTDVGGNPKCNSGGMPPGCGTVFKLDTTGKVTVLHRFSYTPDGAFPSGLIHDAARNFYGIAQSGGATTQDSGTVYKLDAAGKLTVLHSFTGALGGPDGAGPFGALARDPAGNLYGTTAAGGPGNFGTVFKMNATGVETVLYTFTGGTDGENPNGPLVRDASGNLYGTTTYGGAYTSGTVFKLDGNGTKTVLHSFGADKDGQFPMSGLIVDAAGNFYSTTQDGGEYGWGTVFKLDATGTETVLYSFTGKADGKYTIGPVARDAVGNLYGTTQQGGTKSCGVVFKLKP